MLTKTFRSLLIASVAGTVLLAGCTKPAPDSKTDDSAVAIVKLETPPAGQLPEGVIPTAYRLDVITDPAQGEFSGQVEIDIKLDAPHARIWLHSVDQSVENVSARLPDGTQIPATFARSDIAGGVSSLDFETALPAGTATLVITYSAPYNFGLAGLYKASQKDRPYLATQMEPIDARRMLPSFDEPRFKTPWTMTVTAPQGNQVITNGALQSTTLLDNGMVKHSFATTRPIQSYLVALAVGPYDMRDGGSLPTNSIRPDAVPFRGFAPAGKGAQLQEAMDITDEMVAFQEAYFDYPYPYGKLDIIAVPDFAYGAMENAGAIIYRESALLMDERTPLARKRAILTTHAHELAHQWFGNLVTPKWWDDIWLNEAFATWFSYKTMDAIYPGTGFDLSPQRAAIGVMGADSLINARQIRNPITNNGDILGAFDGITYSKGGGVLSMFETYLGDDAFRAGLRLHMRKFEDGVADVNDFMASLAEGSGQPEVVDSFKSFIFQPGIPYLGVSLSCPTPDTGVLTVTQSRYAPLGSKIDPKASTWTVPFAATVQSDAGPITVRQMLSAPNTDIALKEGCPDWVLPNAGGAGYWRFDLSQDQWTALAAVYDDLSAGEQLVFADSVTAAFSAGRISAGTLLDAVLVNAKGDWGAAGNPLGKLGGYFDALPDEESKDAMRAFVMQAYAGRYLALLARPQSELSASDTLLRDQLFGTLLAYGRLDTERERLANAASVYVGQTGTPDAAALRAEDVSRAVGFAAEKGDSAFYQAALTFAKTTENQTERRGILSALAGSLPEADLLDLMGKVQTDAFQGQEAWSVVLAALGNTKAKDAAWQKLQADFPAIIARTPEIRKPQTASLVRYFCDADAIDAAVAFVESQSALMPGYERPLAQAAESARLCAAFRAEKGPELAAALKARQN